MTAPAFRRFAAAMSLSADALVQADGSIWSHAATLGTRIKGDQFTIDQATVENFVRVFSTGYPRKVPVDYEHGTVNGATDYGQPVPKAGDVLELTGVFSPADFTGELKAVAEKLSAKAGRPLDDPRNLGLWIRWRPTQRALGMIKGGEYSELSIAYNPDVKHNVTGEGQGPALLSIALTNLPFLDDMLPVAASRDGGSPAAPGKGDHRMKTTLLAAAAAILAKPVSSDEEAVTELTAFQPEVMKLRKFTADVGAAIGETDPAKAVEKITQLRNDSARLASDLATQKAAKIKTDVDATLAKHEKRLTPATKEYFGKQLTRELESGVALDKSETIAAIEALPETGIAGRASGADNGTAAPEGEKVMLAAHQLMREDPEIKEIHEKQGFSPALREAVKRTERTLGLVK